MPRTRQWLNRMLEQTDKLRPYLPGETVTELAKRLGKPVTDIVKLDANENFLFPKEVLASALCQLSNSLDPRLYPADEKEQLAKALATSLNVHEQQIVLGNSSDELLELVARAFLGENEGAVSVYPTFSMYRVITNATRHGFTEAPLGKDFQLDSKSLLKACESSTVLCFLCSPNNPTGNQFLCEEVRAFAEEFGGLVLVDEAYVEFAQHSLVHLAAQMENLVVLRTFSKAFGLAGMRMGYAIASPRVASMLMRIQLPYNINVMSLKMATEILKHPDVLASTIQSVKAERTWLNEALGKIPKVVAYPSEANFILLKTPRPSPKVAEALKERGILVRGFGDVHGLEGCIRVTVGTREMNSQFICGLEAVMGDQK